MLNFMNKSDVIKQINSYFQLLKISAYWISWFETETVSFSTELESNLFISRVSLKLLILSHRKFQPCKTSEIKSRYWLQSESLTCFICWCQLWNILNHGLYQNLSKVLSVRQNLMSLNWSQAGVFNSPTLGYSESSYFHC